jgi:hypothetical protein
MNFRIAKSYSDWESLVRRDRIVLKTGRHVRNAKNAKTLGSLKVRVKRPLKYRKPKAAGDREGNGTM